MGNNAVANLHCGHGKHNHPQISTVTSDDRGSETQESRQGSVYTSYTSVPIYQALSPMLFCMKLFGLYYTRDYHWPSTAQPSMCCTKRKEENDRPSTKISKWTPSHIYATVILVAAILNLGRMMSVFNKEDTFGPELFDKVIQVVWMTLCLLNSLGSYIACAKYDRLPAFFILWGKIHASNERTLCVQYLRRRVMVFSMAVFAVHLTITLLGIVAIFETFLFDVTLAPFDPEDSVAISVRIVYVSIYIYLIASWIFVPVFDFLIASVVQHEFAHFNAEIKSKIGSNGDFDGDFEAMRQKHDDLCTLLTHADDCHFLQNGAGFVFNGLICLLIMYNILWYPEVRQSSLIVIALCTWLVANFSILGLIAVGGAMVNAEAHGSSDDVHTINMAKLPSASLHQVNVFVARLNGSAIGLTVLKLFVIDKPTILTLVGMLATYFVLVIQFSPAFTGSSTDGNCTCIFVNA